MKNESFFVIIHYGRTKYNDGSLSASIIVKIRGLKNEK